MEDMSQDARPCTYKVPDNIAWVDGADLGMADELYLTMVPSGNTVLLKDSARLIWLVATGGGDVLDEVSSLVEVPGDEINAHVSEFLAVLLSQGLLALDVE